TSRGNLANPALPSVGADISVESGLGSVASRDFTTFINDYLAATDTYQADLVAYMQPRLGGSPTFSESLTAYKALPSTAQAPLIETIFFDELRASGRAAAESGASHGNFTRGCAASEALFPGGNPDPGKGETNPYAGDIALYFSRMYTLDDGNIRLLSPGGAVNAGLATPPASFGITKDPSELGIVAQSTGSV